MRFNFWAFFTGIAGLSLINGVFTYTMWHLGIYFNEQIQDIPFYAKLLLYIAPAILNVTWFICIFRFFDNGSNVVNKTHKVSKTFASPDGFQGEGLLNLHDNLSRRTRTFLLYGSIAALLISINSFFQSTEFFHNYRITSTSSCDGVTTVTVYDKNSVMSSNSPKLKVFADKLKNYLSTQKSNETLQTQPQNLGKWHSIFTSDLECFSEEKEAYDVGKLNEVTINGITGRFYLNRPPDLMETVEYWIDPTDSKHFKMRYIQIRRDFEIIGWYSTSKSYYFYDIDKKCFDTDDLVVENNSDFEYLVYDSKTNRTRFEFDGFFANFFERYKWIFYIVWYLFGFGVCVLIIKIMRKLSKGNFFKGKVHSQTVAEQN